VNRFENRLERPVEAWFPVGSAGLASKFGRKLHLAEAQGLAPASHLA
jgi:hypothetical protein